MQLTLLTTFAPSSVAASKDSPRGPAQSREAMALSQLDRIAAQNLRTSGHGLGASGVLLALIGGLVVLGSASMWRGTGGDEARPPVAAAGPPATPASVAPAASPLLAVAAAQGNAGALQTTPPAQVTAAPTTAVAVAAPDTLADDAARKARARQLAEARRKAARLAQERAAAEESQRLQLAQQREAERVAVADQARQRAAAEQARPQPIQLALNTQRSVGHACSASGGPISRHFCSARECAKPEHQSDPVCVNLREHDLARQRASNDR